MIYLIKWIFGVIILIIVASALLPILILSLFTWDAWYVDIGGDIYERMMKNYFNCKKY